MNNIYIRSKYFILFASMSVAIVAFVVSTFLPPMYEASVTFSVLKRQVQVTTDYQFDDYYAFQSEELYGKTIMSWFSSSTQLKTLATTAGIAVSDQQLGSWARQFNVKQAAAQNITVRYKDKEQASAVAVGDALTSFVAGEVTQQLARAGQQDEFVVTGSQAVVVKKEAAWWLLTAIGLIIGFIASVVVVGLRAYIRTEGEEVIAQERIDVYMEE